MSSGLQPLQRILLVDDNPVDRRLVIRELSREFDDLDIYEAPDLKTFERALPNRLFDLVVTDYELNWSTGIEVLNQVKAHDPMMPVVMFTDSGSQEIAVEAMKAGLDDYVLKSPKHLIRLAQAVRVAWENSQIRRRANELDIRQRFLLNHLEVGVFRVSLEGRLLEANKGFLRLLGLASLDEAKAFFHDNFEFETVNRAATERAEWERQLRLPQGSVKWVQISEVRVEQNGHIVIDGIVSDITEKKETAIALQRFNQELETRVQERTAQLEDSNRQLLETNEELELLAYSLSHDLQAPIRQINGFAELLREELTPLADNQNVQDYLQRINYLTKQGTRMIFDLLDYSRTGRTQMHYTTVDMSRIVTSIQQQVSSEQPDREIIWKVDPLSEVEGDPSLLKRVWQNLLSNAVKYSSQQHPAVIAISSRNDGSFITFWVEDNGAGFDEQYRDRLFTPFKRLHSEEEFEGTGIGLASVKRILLRHGGRVWATSPDDQGATFYFSLPKKGYGDGHC
ncbi:sensor histidine kinase [Almyronema epifaneia]|uniref:histidine kinase n=1 Tax=Almyronema epifaneia S1 TaxID=2991925 RepID=A0ABW6IDV3_9CYAN